MKTDDKRRLSRRTLLKGASALVGAGAGMTFNPDKRSLFSAPAVHQHDEVGKCHRLVLAVRDVQERDAELLLQPL